MNENNINPEEVIKARIIKAMLSIVPLYGWSEDVLLKALDQEKLPDSYSWRLFPNGISDVIQQWQLIVDHEMLEVLKETQDTSLRTTEKITLAIKTRFQILAPHKPAMIRAWGVLSSPKYIRLKFKISYNTINTIWYFAGDKSVDFNFYTKRGLLLSVYVSTLLYWFSDLSEESQDTWGFLARQLKRVGYIPRVKSYAQEKATKFVSQIQNIANRFTR